MLPSLCPQQTQGVANKDTSSTVGGSCTSVLNILEDGCLFRGLVGDIGLWDDRHITACQVRILNRSSFPKLRNHIAIVGQGVCVVEKASVDYPIGTACSMKARTIMQFNTVAIFL